MARPSPPQHAAQLAVGTVKSGSDGAKWVVKALPGGSRRWARLPSLGGKAYLVHDNGGAPFKVVVTTEKVVVFERDPSFDGDVYLKRVLAVRGPKAVYPGTYRGPHYESPSPKGNSVLVQVGPARFIFIGSTIFHFRLSANDEFSRLGNSDVPYPWVVGTRFISLLAEQIALPIVPGLNVADPYAHYYGLTHGAQKALLQSSRMKVTRVLAGAQSPAR
jgi:hypothetical protein